MHGGVTEIERGGAHGLLEGEHGARLYRGVDIALVVVPVEVAAMFVGGLSRYAWANTTATPTPMIERPLII